MKRGQISIFIIMTILILAIVFLIFLNRDYIFNNSGKISPEILPVKNFIDKCIEETGKEAIMYVSSTGGYFSSPNLSTENHIAYYLYNQNNYMPEKEKIEREISDYMNEMMFFCVKGFGQFNDFEITQSEIKTKTKIFDNKVVLQIEYPLSIVKNNRTYYVKNFNQEINVNLGKVYNIVKEIMEEQLKQKELICMSCIGKISLDNDVYVDMFDLKDKEVVFSVTDRNSKINEKELEFVFANKYGK